MIWEDIIKAKGLLHQLFDEQEIQLKNVEKLRRKGEVFAGTYQTITYELTLGDETYRYTLADPQNFEINEDYFLLEGLVKDGKQYYRGISGKASNLYTKEYENDLETLQDFYNMVYR